MLRIIIIQLQLLLINFDYNVQDTKAKNVPTLQLISWLVFNIHRHFNTSECQIPNNKYLYEENFSL